MNAVLKTAMIACLVTAPLIVTSTASAQDRRGHDRYEQRWDGAHSDHRYDTRRHDRRGDRRHDNRYYDGRYSDHRYQSHYVAPRHDYRYATRHQPSYSLSFSYGYGPQHYGYYSSRWAPQRYRAPVRYVYPADYRAYSWRVGERLPMSYRAPMYYVDYRDYRLAPPPYGYHWVRVNNDIVLMALATGIIAEVLGGAFY
jgi:Ni/Co efflux regulator RcnB